MTKQRESTSSTEPLPVPEHLLSPLLDAAADTLARMDGRDVPSVLRTLSGFDKRGMTSGPARQQLRRALDVDDDFRAAVVERFRARRPVEAALEAWSLGAAQSQIADAAERSDLPLLASALYAARPRGWSFGLGLVCATAERGRTEQEHGEEVKAVELRATSFDEARRRAERARDEALEDIARLELELRDERSSRREREVRAAEEVEEANRRRAEAERLAELGQASAGAAEARSEREAERAREAEKQLRIVRRELDEMRRERAEAARRDAVERRAAEAAASVEASVATTSNEPAAATRRTRAPCPPGMRSDTPEALDAMLRTRGVVLVVDGYNVSIAGWGDANPAEQRDRLLGALERLHLRLRCEVVVVFDGADVDVIPSKRRSGVRVVFSSAEEEADPVIVRQVASRPTRVPVIVASSDQWVHDHAEAEGATVVPALALVDVLRR